MKLLNLMLADAASADSAGKLYIHGGNIFELEAEDFPYSQPNLAVVVTLAGEASDVGADPRHLRIFRLDPDGQPMDDLHDMTLPEPEGGGAPNYFSMIGHMIGLRFPREGRYWIVAEVDGAEVARVPLHVGTGGLEVTHRKPPSPESSDD